MAVALSQSFFGDIFALTKPKITVMTVFLSFAGLLHAKQAFVFWPAFLVLLGIGALVSGSSALNMYLERDLDRYMARTKDRPLPSGRIESFWAVIVGVFCSVISCLLIYASSNVLTLILGALSLILYVFLYTPLKRKTWFALVIGSVPGAMPVMLGYTAYANTIDEKALALFFWAFLWQIPHFIAISLFREQEYTEAGFPVLSATYNEKSAKIALLGTSWLLVLSTVFMYVSHVISAANLACCLSLGVYFLFVCHKGAFSMNTSTWARRAFKASLVYQSLLFVLLVIDAF